MFSKRLIYFSAAEAPKFTEEAGKSPEGQKTPEQKLSDEQQKFKAKADQVTNTAKQYLKNSDPGVQAAAKEALAKVKLLENSPLLDKKSIDAELEQINRITAFVDLSKNVQEQKSRLVGEREKTVKDKGAQLSKFNADLIALHPELIRHNNATILLKRLEGKYADSLKQSVNGPVSKEMAISPAALKVNFAEHLKDPTQLTQVSAELGSALTFDRSFEHDLEAKTADFATEANSIVAEYLSKMPEESTKYVANEMKLARGRLDASGVYNKTQLLADLKQLEESTLGNLDLTKHAGEENKRAMIMANFKDSLNQIVGKALVDNIAENPAATKENMAKKLKITPDQLGKLFEQQGTTLLSQEGLSSETKYQILANDVQIRNVDGSELSYLSKNQKVQILDQGVYVINDAYKAGGTEAYRYYKVRLEPQGAVGLVEAKFVNFEPKVRIGTTTVEKGGAGKAVS